MINIQQQKGREMLTTMTLSLATDYSAETLHS